MGCGAKPHVKKGDIYNTMLCDKCKKNAAQVYYTENINGKETKYALCHDCAAEMKKSGELGIGLPSIFGGGIFGGDMGSLIGSILAPQKTARAEDSKKCDLCGMTFADLKKEGKAGCPRCYDTFGDELERTVAGIHGGTKHTGKVPAKYKAKIADAEKIASLRAKINEAVAAEDYETAAKLRDEIRAIEGKGETA